MSDQSRRQQGNAAGLVALAILVVAAAALWWFGYGRLAARWFRTQLEPVDSIQAESVPQKTQPLRLTRSIRIAEFGGIAEVALALACDFTGPLGSRLSLVGVTLDATSFDNRRGSTVLDSTEVDRMAGLLRTMGRAGDSLSDLTLPGQFLMTAGVSHDLGLRLVVENRKAHPVLVIRNDAIRLAPVDLRRIGDVAAGAWAKCRTISP